MLPQPATTILKMPVANPQLHATDPQLHAANLQVNVSDPQLHATDPQMNVSDPQLHATALLMPAAESQVSAKPNTWRRSVYKPQGSMEQRLMVAKVAIEAVLNDALLQEMFTAYGYNAAELRRGLALRAQALALFQQQQARVGKQLAATDSRANIQAQAQAVYKRHVALARVALHGERNATRALDLSARKKTLAGWVLQAQQFYANALADQAIVAKLGRYNVTKEQLLATQVLVEEVANGIVAQQSSKGSAKEAKLARDAALRSLDRWMLDFIAIARIALAGQPPRLAQIGLARR
jgi:hypothetical protein